jgi:hypothetical protein
MAKMILSAPPSDWAEWISLDFEGTAAWRHEKAHEYPEDARNKKAADLLKKLAATVADIPPALLIRLGRVFEAELETCQFEWSSHLRQVGFHTFPETAEEFVREFLELLRVEKPPGLSVVD